jgi:hypothetical protein
MEDEKTTGLVELWSKTKGELESRVFQDEDQFVLVIRRIQPGQPKQYVFWHPYPNLEAAKAQVPS